MRFPDGSPRQQDQGSWFIDHRRTSPHFAARSLARNELCVGFDEWNTATESKGIFNFDSSRFLVVVRLSLHVFLGLWNREDCVSIFHEYAQEIAEGLREVV